MFTSLKKLKESFWIAVTNVTLANAVRPVGSWFSPACRLLLHGISFTDWSKFYRTSQTLVYRRICSFVSTMWPSTIPWEDSTSITYLASCRLKSSCLEVGPARLFSSRAFWNDTINIHVKTGLDFLSCIYLHIHLSYQFCPWIYRVLLSAWCVVLQSASFPFSSSFSQHQKLS
jgi:hypothetical protein